MDRYTFIMAENCDDCRDRRYRYLAESIKSDGYKVELLQDGNISDENYVLVLPFGFDEEKTLSLINKLPKGSLAVGGSLPPTAVESVLEKDIKYKNLLLDEEFCLKNAIATAEGALMRAIELTDKTIYKSNCAIFGYGRIGKRLCELFRSCGAKVTVFCTSKSEADIAFLHDLDAFLLAELEGVNLGTVDILVNTVPAHHILDAEVLGKLKKECIVIDLASGANNVNWNFADSRGIKNYRAPSLPGKFSPRSAAEYIKDSIYRFCECDLQSWQP